MIADGRGEFPTGLAPPDRDRLLAAVRRRLRDRMVRHIARAIAARLRRDPGPSRRPTPVLDRKYDPTLPYRYVMYGRMSDPRQNQRSPDQQFATIRESDPPARLPLGVPSPATATTASAADTSASGPASSGCSATSRPA